MIIKNVDDILNSLIDEVTNLCPMLSKDDIVPGSVIRSILEALAVEIYNIYLKADEIEKNSRISTASGFYLDEIGALVGCSRLEGEDDDSFRYRIMNTVPNSRTSSIYAIEDAIKNHDGVYSYDIKKNYYGPGSFAVFLQVINGYDPNNVAETLKEKLQSIVAAGIMFDILPPKQIPVKLNLYIVGNITDKDIAKIKNEVSKYISSIKPGNKLYKSKLIGIINSISSVESVIINNIIVNNKTIATNEVELLDGEQFILDSIDIIM